MTVQLSETQGFRSFLPFGMRFPHTDLSGTTDAIPLNGSTIFYVIGAAIDAMTLGLPQSGGFSAPGNVLVPAGMDGSLLIVISTTAFAHTITTPANGINGNKHIATFAAAVGNGIAFLARAGVWWVWPGGNTGVTLT